jgi:ribosomal protein S18 acetylase RimI-like enzyme
MDIRKAALQDLPLIQQLAQEIWWPTYEAYISEAQISFMLTQIYNLEALKAQMEEGHTFILLYQDEKAVGFSSYSFSHTVCKIHKLYILPALQGMGAGKQIMNYISAEAFANGATLLRLNVNRNNPALHFYQRLGFCIAEEVDIPYYEFILNDYVMERHIEDANC